VESKDYAQVKCEFCNGTGGSAGNDDPADNWICAACNGTGSYDDGYDPEPEPVPA
jgi:hypothetical protein